MLSNYTPMAPTLVRAPFHREGWIYEEKVDGCADRTVVCSCGVLFAREDAEFDLLRAASLN